MSQFEKLTVVAPTADLSDPGTRKSFLLWRVFAGALMLALTVTVFGQGSGDLPPVKSKGKPTTRPTKPAPVKPPVPKPEEAPTHRDPPSVPDIVFNKPVAANLDPAKSGQISAVAYYDEYSLKATDADLFTIQLETSDPALTIQFFDKSGAGLPIIKDPRAGDYRLDTPGGRVSSSDEWHVRVLGSFSPGKLSPVGYTLTVKRTGLTDVGYNARLQTIVQLFNATKDVNETERQLTQLSQDDPTRPGAFEMLGVIYAANRKDFEKAEQAMERALALKGSATFKVTHDQTPGKKLSKKGDTYDFPEPREAWLKISDGQLSLIEIATGQPVVFSVSGTQIRDLALTKAADFSVITLKAGVQSKAYILCPATRTQTESDLILKLIKAHVLGKA